MCNTHYFRDYHNTDMNPVKPDEKCIIEECNNKHYAKGYCKNHYYKLVKKYPSKNNYVKKLNHIEICIIEGCDKQVKSKGLCQKHYQAQYFQEVTKEKRKKKKNV